MRLNKWIGGCAVAAALVAGSGIPAWAVGASGLPWKSPAKVVSGVPVRVASIAPCPAPPTAGDTVLVQINLSFGAAGGSGQVLEANANRSWSGDVTFFFSGVNIRQTTISAECLDFDGITGVPYAHYMARHTQIFE